MTAAAVDISRHRGRPLLWFVALISGRTVLSMCSAAGVPPTSETKAGLAADGVVGELVRVRGRDYAVISCGFRSGAGDWVKSTAQ